MPEGTLEQYEAEKAAGFPGQYQQQLIDIYNKAKTYEQAQKDVSAASAMMGALRVQQAIQKGVDPATATYSNLNYFIRPNDKGYAAVLQQLRPVAPPYATNFPGINAPVVIAPTRSGQTVHFPPSSVLPQTDKTPTELKTIPIIGPDGKPLPDFFGVPSASGKGVTTHRRTNADLTPEEQATVKYQQSIANANARVAAEAGPKSALGSNALAQAQAATNVIHQIYNKPKVATNAPRIRVREKSSGKLGWWEGSDALPSDYEKVE